MSDNWDHINLRVSYGVQYKHVIVYLNKHCPNDMRTRQSNFPCASKKYDSKTTTREDVDRDSDYISQDYIDEICKDFVSTKKENQHERNYTHDDCKDIPKGITIYVHETAHFDEPP